MGIPQKIHIKDIGKYKELANFTGANMNAKKNKFNAKKTTYSGVKYDSKNKTGKAVLVFEELPKISLNKWYSGEHWTNRKEIKDTYKILAREVTQQIFTKPCEVEYHFEFRIRPLDISNSIAMVKMIEDCLFPDDSYKIVQKLTITSKKAKEDKLIVIISEKDLQL